MTFFQIPQGTAIFLDANTLVYHFTAHALPTPFEPLIAGVIQAHGLTNLASNDTDFDRVSGLTRFAPV